MSQNITTRTGEIMDRLIQIEIRSEKYLTLPTWELYEACRDKVGEPLTYAAAKRMVNSVQQGDFVMIAAGFTIPPWCPKSETDGVPSSIALARVIALTLGARCLFLTDDSCVDVFSAGARAAGLTEMPLDLLKSTPQAGSVARAVGIQAFPLDNNLAEKEARRLLEELQPKAIIAIEKCGPNEKGVCHTAMGNDMSAHTAKLHHLFDQANEAKILTIGCLDIGNEIGGGSIRNTVHKVWKYGSRCQCPCGGGVASVTETEIPIPGSNSAWGAYGIAAVLAGMKENLRAMHTADLERRIMEKCLDAGMRDAATLAPTLTLSGADVDDYTHLLELMNAVIKYAFVDYQPFKLRY